jgi:hypothetical protein
MLDAILSLARLFPVFHDIGASEGEPRLQRRREAHGRSLHASTSTVLLHHAAVCQILKVGPSVKCYKYFTVLSRSSCKVGAGSHLRELGPDLNPHPPTTPTRLGPKLNSLPVANYRDRLTDTRYGHAAYAGVLCVSSIPSIRGRAARYFYRNTNAAIL